MEISRGIFLNGHRVLSLALFVTMAMNLWRCVRCINEQEIIQTNVPATSQLLTELVYNSLFNLTAIFSGEIKDRLSFCVKDVNADWNGAFNFSSNLGFLSSCIKTKGDLTQRLCTAAEIKFYFSGFYESGSKSTNYLKPNKNCNLTSWVSGCEPGWACSAGANEKVDLKNVKQMPARTFDCSPCCEGFFCPHGITCMIPCPLGSYCPLASLNKRTGICEPYGYQLPPGHSNHSCGGADIWADVGSSTEALLQGRLYLSKTLLPVGKL